MAPASPPGSPAWTDMPAALLRPKLQGLTDFLSFSPGDGRIWLDNQRMVLFHASAFGAMRREIIAALGLDKGRDALRRIGYAQGKRDAELIRQRWRDEHPMAQAAAGPRLHTLEGFAKVRTLHYEYDAADGAYRAEFLWGDSVEADEHLAAFGVSDRPACWTLCGYAAGFASTMQGRAILFRETECRCTGAAQCRVTAKPAAEWPDEAPIVTPPEDGAPPRPDGYPMMPSRGAMVGCSPGFLAARQLLEQVAPTDATVLLRGETGVGKELFATTLHRLSKRGSGPFIAVNCAALPGELVEAELFGVERGAFTGATVARPGRFERADGGTLFLDEIGLMSLAAQAKLLRALQDRAIERVGGTRHQPVDVRVVAASNVDLWTEVQANRFRRDLFYRLNVFPIELPPLRARRDDIAALLEHFLGHYAALHGRRVRGFSSSAMRALLNYEYPGNVRELQNLVERGVISAGRDASIETAHIFRPGEQGAGRSFTVGSEGRLRPADGAPEATSPPAVIAAGLKLGELERSICQEALRACSGNVAAAARRLGLTRPTLEYRLRKWGIVPSRGSGATR
jgi:two-component system, NtrC family, response regulator HydG